jgi:hypothetical protein
MTVLLGDPTIRIARCTVQIPRRLVESIRDFPSQGDFALNLKEGYTRFKKAVYHNSAHLPRARAPRSWGNCCFSVPYWADDGPLLRRRSLLLKETLSNCPWTRSPITLTIFTPLRLGFGMSPRSRMSCARRTGCLNLGLTFGCLEFNKVTNR